jgi:hypothetical protein
MTELCAPDRSGGREVDRMRGLRATVSGQDAGRVRRPLDVP